MTLYNNIRIVLAVVAVYGLVKALYRLFIRPLFSPLRDLQGPPIQSFILGNLDVKRNDETFARHDRWLATYGKVMHLKSNLWGDRLFTTDTRVLNHVLTHSMDYQKAAEVRFTLSRIVGDGILVTEGDQHRQQRRIMNPSFAPSSIKDLTPIFFQKAIQLRDIWSAELASQNADIKGARKFEVLSWLSRATLDIIGLAGFNYHFDSLNVQQEPDALSKAFETLLHSSLPGAFTLLQSFVPILRSIPTQRTREEQRARKTMREIGEGLLRERRQGGTLEKGRDLLSVLVRANMDDELPVSQRMNDEDVLAQVPTFLVAGHETTSTQTTWALFALSQHPETQSRLRAELRTMPTDMPTADDLGAETLPYLDAVVREVLRIYAVVPISERIAMHDDVIPVSEPYFDRKGKVCREVRVRKGEGIIIPILALNRSKEIWGEDAFEFKPDRWFKEHATTKDIPGVWSELMTFLGGAHSCIGYRFAIYEMKALLYTLLRTFEFSLAVPSEQVECVSMIVTRPYVRGEKGAQMPLMVKLCNDAH